MVVLVDECEFCGVQVYYTGTGFPAIVRVFEEDMPCGTIEVDRKCKNYGFHLKNKMNCDDLRVEISGKVEVIIYYQ